VQSAETYTAATKGSVPDQLLLGAHAPRDTLERFVKEVNVQANRAKMVVRVLEKTNVNVHFFTLVLSAKGKDWELKRTRHQTLRQF